MRRYKTPEQLKAWRKAREAAERVKRLEDWQERFDRFQRMRRNGYPVDVYRDLGGIGDSYDEIERAEFLGKV